MPRCLAASGHLPVGEISLVLVWVTSLRSRRPRKYFGATPVLASVFHQRYARSCYTRGSTERPLLHLAKTLQCPTMPALANSKTQQAGLWLWSINFLWQEEKQERKTTLSKRKKKRRVANMCLQRVADQTTLIRATPCATPAPLPTRRRQ